MPQSLANILIHAVWSTKEREYVEGLAEHHKKLDFKAEGEFCKRYNVAIDERYVWD